MSGGLKYDVGKPSFDLLPPSPITEIAKVFEMGKRKYSARNWEMGIEWGRVYAALQRHLHAFWGGETTDPESGLPHLAHAGFGILVLLEFLRTHPELDDRSVSEARDDFLSKPAQPAAAEPVPGQDAQPAHGGDSGRLVFGVDERLVDRIQVPDASFIIRNPAPDAAQSVATPVVSGTIGGRKECCGDFRKSHRGDDTRDGF